MADEQEGYLMIIVAAVVMVAFALTVLAVMVIFRKRKLEHIHQIDRMNASFAQELLQTQLEAQRQTMQQIGQEIHDNVGQKITLASLYVIQLNQDDTTLSSKVEAISDILHESLSDLRSLSRDLTDAGHADADLYLLIQKECQRAQATGSCKVMLEGPGTKIEAPTSVKHIVVRIIQEFFHNSLKHAACSEIQVLVQVKEAGLHVRAIDNGRGFLPGNRSTAGIGLANMQKRATLIGAQLTLESHPGAGTQLDLVIPLKT